MSRTSPAWRVAAALVAGLAVVACAQEQQAPATSPTTTSTGCLVAGDGRLEASLRGALVADIAWSNAQMQCEGGTRPDGRGLRVSVVGPLAATADAPARRLRFIFGIDPRDTAGGVATALPTNLTVIVEGAQQMFATRGDDKCAVERLERSPLPGGSGKRERVEARGYCVGPASDLAGEARLLVPTFAFTALIDLEEKP